MRLNTGFQFLPCMKRNDAPRAYWNLLTGFRIPSRPFVLLSKIKITEARQFNLLAVFQSCPDLFEKLFDELFRFPFIEAQLIKEPFGHIGFR